MPLLVGLSLAALLWRRSAGRRAVLACGLAAVCLLGEALALPDGIPGPGADLGRFPPWSSTVEARPGNPAMQDVTFQIYPWLLYLRHEVRSGRWPFWNPHQFSGMTFWGNGQSAPLSPFHLLFVLLPLQIGFLLLPWLRIVVAGLGTHALARELGLSEAAASVAAITFPLSGMLVSFLLFPMGNALAVVPWVFWAVERVLSGRGGWSVLGSVVGLQVVAGHPETSLHTLLLTILYGALRSRLREQRAWAWARLAAGWALGLLLGAVVLLPLASTVWASARWQQAAELRGPEPPWSVLLPLPLRLVLPDLYGNPARGTWWGPFNYLATAVYAGALALPLVALALAGVRRDRRRAAWLVVVGFSAAAAYHAPLLTPLLNSLPLVGDALHHRLLFGVELGLAILVGYGAESWLAGGARAGAWGIAVGGLLIAGAAALYAGEWRSRSLAAGQLRWILWVLLLWALYWISLRLPPAMRARAVPLLVVVVALDLVAAHRSINPAQRLGDLYPESGAIAFMRGREGRVAGTGSALRPNAAMVYGLDDIRGDDSLKPRLYEDILAELGGHHPAYFTPLERWGSEWLDRLGVRWILTLPGAAAPDPGWRLAYDGADARVFERPSAPPLVRWAVSQAAPPRVVTRLAGRWEIALPAAPDGGTIVVAEGWDAGWQGELDGRALALERVEGNLIGALAPPGARQLTLRYRPAGFWLGLGGTCCGALALAWGWRRGW